jgi:hypothetical protein
VNKKKEAFLLFLRAKLLMPTRSCIISGQTSRADRRCVGLAAGNSARLKGQLVSATGSDPVAALLR